jgi:hypothetical protein
MARRGWGEDSYRPGRNPNDDPEKPGSKTGGETVVTVGVDPHKRTHTLVAVDDVGKKLAERTLAATSEGQPGTPHRRESGIIHLGERRSRAAAYCFVTWMLFAPVVSVNPAVWLVNDPFTDPNVTAV